MIDTTQVATALTRLINAGVAERDLVAAVAHLFPNLSPAELVASPGGRDDRGRAAGDEGALSIEHAATAEAVARQRAQPA